jgi:hypothetical protein
MSSVIQYNISQDIILQGFTIPGIAKVVSVCNTIHYQYITIHI